MNPSTGDAARAALVPPDRPVRSFVALPCPPALRAAIAAARPAWRNGPADVAWTDPARAHSTLRFLGNAPPEGLAAIDRGLAEIAARTAAFRVRPGATGAFPGWARPRVVWLGLEDGAALAALAAAVEAAARAAGFAAEPKAWRAHVTLGRARGRVTAEALSDVRTWVPDTGPEEVGTVVLYQSQLGPGGARHAPLATYALAGAP